MLPAAFVTPSPAASSRPHPAARPIVAGDLYSLRARRRFATYLRLRLLELREEHLERAAEVIEHRLPVDALVPELSAGPPPR